MSWKITAFASADIVRAALVAHEDATDWPADLVLAGSEIAEDKPDDWQLEVWLENAPTEIELAAVTALFGGNAPELITQELADEDWVTLSQQGVEPIREGPFYVHTPDYPALPGRKNFVIPASQAFGTGQHATTAGCLAMLAHMRAQGVRVRNMADIGTGTGLLAFAALHLWPRARVIASDIDAVCAPVIAANMAANAIEAGEGPGQLAVVIAPGMAHPLLRAAAPYDLVIANILAGPLIALAQDFASSVMPGGNLLLAGLLETQEAAVRAAYRREGFRMSARMVRGDWSILWLRRRSGRFTR